jgi:hypothetical protein
VILKEWIINFMISWCTVWCLLTGWDFLDFLFGSMVMYFCMRQRFGGNVLWWRLGEVYHMRDVVMEESLF